MEGGGGGRRGRTQESCGHGEKRRERERETETETETEISIFCGLPEFNTRCSCARFIAVGPHSYLKVDTKQIFTEFRRCVKVEVAILMSLTVSVDVKQH